MGIRGIHDSTHFHQLKDVVLTGWQGAEPAEVDKHLIIQEREVSYRLALHQHPYVGQLMQRLLSRDTSALLAPDTDFASGSDAHAGNPARPDSVVFALVSDVV